MTSELYFEWLWSAAKMNVSCGQCTGGCGRVLANIKYELHRLSDSRCDLFKNQIDKVTTRAASFILATLSTALVLSLDEQNFTTWQSAMMIFTSKTIFISELCWRSQVTISNWNYASQITFFILLCFFSHSLYLISIWKNCVFKKYV